MNGFQCVYVPVGVGTYHMETAQDQFERSVKTLKSADEGIVCPEKILLSVEELREYLKDKAPDLIVFQNITFANGAYMSEVLRTFNVPMLLWTLREPVIDGGRLRSNSLTGAYSAANALRAFNDRPFMWCFGAPEEDSVISAIRAYLSAAKLKKAMKSLRMAAIGLTPQGFGFGRALDSELMNTFGVDLGGLEKTPAKNVADHSRLMRAYTEFVKSHGIGALASRCWPDFFTAYGTPVCTVLSMLNDQGVAAACEADIYGALSMWIGMQLSGEPVFFGDPVSLDEKESSITYWHCGAGACSLARKDTGAVVGVHPNRKIGPAMDFGCEAFPEATIFRIGRQPDGTFRFFIAEGEALDKPKQFIGTSIVVKTENPSRDIVEDSILNGFEPHFVVMKGHFAKELEALALMMGFEVYAY